MVTTANIPRVTIQSASAPSGTVMITKTLKSATNPIAFEAVARSPEIGDGSRVGIGCARWNGAHSP